MISSIYNIQRNFKRNGNYRLSLRYFNLFFMFYSVYFKTCLEFSESVYRQINFRSIFVLIYILIKAQSCGIFIIYHFTLFYYRLRSCFIIIIQIHSVFTCRRRIEIYPFPKILCFSYIQLYSGYLSSVCFLSFLIFYDNNNFSVVNTNSRFSIIFNPENKIHLFIYKTVPEN